MFSFILTFQLCLGPFCFHLSPLTGHWTEQETEKGRRGPFLKIRTHRVDSWASLVAQMVKNLPAMQETWVQSLGLEDPLERRMATHSCILAWRIPWTEEPGGLLCMGLQSGMTE